MKLSFVVPAYNEEALIGRCLEAMLSEISRGGYDCEIVVVNNASIDATAKIAGGFDGVRVVEEPKKGLVRARQAGLLATDGDLIANIDADCRLPEGWIDKVLSEFHRDQQLVALSGPFHYDDVAVHVRILTDLFYRVGYCVYWFDRYVLRTGAMLQGGNFVVRRSAMEAIGGFDTSIDFYGEDTDVARRISKVGKVKWTFNLPIHTSARRLNSEGLFRTGVRYALNFLFTNFTGRVLTKTHNDIRPEETRSRESET